MNVERTICGLATVFDQPSPRGRVWHVGHFRDFLNPTYPSAVPLRVDHGALVTSWGVINSIGVVRSFAAVTAPVPGLLCLAELSEIGEGDWLLNDLELMLRQTWLPAGWGMSLGANQLDDVVIPFEVSVTRSPGFEDAVILDVGEDAITTWEPLTGAPIGVRP